MATTEFLAALGKIFPLGRMLTQPAALASYESDALTAYQVRPRAVVLPETAEEVIAAVRLCHEYRVPFLARGTGTGLSGGALPIADGIVIAMNRLNHILRLDPLERLAVVEPGVVNLEVTKAAAPFGLYYSPDPASQSICTIGGNLAFNAGGAHCLKYGMTSNHVLKLKAVLPDGEVVTFGGESLEDHLLGLTGLYIGSEGLFGVVLEATLRLMPKPEMYRTVLAAYDSLEAAGNAVSAVVASGLLPGALEFMDRLAIEAAEAAVHPNYPPGAEAVLIVELEGDRDQVAAEFDLLMELLETTHPQAVRIAQDEADRQRIWKGRKSAFSAVGRLSPDFLVQDGVVPRSRLGPVMAEIGRLSTEYGIRVANVFHAGDGNLHPLIMYNGREPGAYERAEELAGKILRVCVACGGSITGEHGIGIEKRAYLPEMYNEDDIDAMHRLRLAMDPFELSNRGKMFPDGTAPSLRSTGPHPLERLGIISRE